MACICGSQYISAGQHCFRAKITRAIIFILQVRTVGLRKVNKWLKVTRAVIEGAGIWPQVCLALNTVHVTISFYCLPNLWLTKCILILSKKLKPTHGLMKEGVFMCFAHQHHVWLKSHHSLDHSKLGAHGVQVQPLSPSLHALWNLAGLFSVVF